MITFQEFGETILTRREAEGIRGIRSEKHRWMLHVSKANFASMPIDEIRSTHIRAWIRDMIAKPANDTRGERTLHPSSVKRSFSLASTIFTSSVEEELREINPCIGVKIPKLTDRSRNATRISTARFCAMRLERPA